MRKGLFAPVFFVLLLGGCSPPEPHEVEIRLTPRTVRINGAAFVPGWQRSVLEEQLGKAERSDTVRDPNAVLVYDAMGLKVFLPEPGKVKEVQLNFGMRDPDRLTPKGRFQGKVFVNGVLITPTTRAQDLILLRGWGYAESLIEHCYSYSTENIYLYLQYNDDEDELTSISFGPVTY